MKKQWIGSLVLVFLGVAAAPVNAAVILGQVQTFDDPDHGWVFGAGPVLDSPQTHPLALGGPAGSTDPYLQLVSTGGSGTQSRLSAQNFDQWAGDYLSAGISSIEMDLRNFGTTDVFLRLVFIELGPSGPVNVAFSSDAIFIPGSSNWQSIAFDITPSALTAVLGTVDGALTNASELRLFHNPNPSFLPGQNPAIAATLGVDNITASASVVPEPATGVLLSIGLLYGLARRRSH